MHRTIRRAGLAGLALVALLATGSIAAAETVQLKADLKGSNAAATGNATVTYDTASKQVTWRITYSGLSGTPTAAHFHGPAQPGANAGVAVPIPNPATSPIQGSATLTDAQAADLLAGRYYINIHTAANPPGEVRGQVTK
jgi:CHRD domain